MEKNLLQLATIRVNCYGETGTALLYFPGQDLEYVYVFTAKHCLAGVDFKYEFSYRDILLDRIFNWNTKSFHSYTLSETDRIIVSDNSNDIAVLVLPKFKILELTGLEFNYQVIDSSIEVQDFIIRGFALINDQKDDRSFPLSFHEDIKHNPTQFLLKSFEVLDTYYEQAGVNVKGLSGAGAFAQVLDNLYLVGIIHSFEEKNLFLATKISCINHLLIQANYEKIPIIRPETSTLVMDTFKQIEKNEIGLNTRIKNRVGNLNVPRNTRDIDDLLHRTGIAIIFGKPGVGKSAIAKSLISTLRQQSNVTVISFSSEHIDSDTLEEALSKAGYKADFQSILKSPLVSARIVIWVESFEKVIESNRLDAFKELLIACKQHSNVQVLITMRDYTLQRFRINLRSELPVGDIYYPLKGFDNFEMELVKASIPEIKPLLENPKIQHLLRTPYYLDQAIRILPELLGNDQLDERGFKKLMWENIVEQGKKARGDAFISICLKRALEMSLYTLSDQPQELIDELTEDNLLQSSSEEITRYTPSHDILEDWSLTRYIQQQWLTTSIPKDFITSIENNPALTRAFRIWLEEFYRNESQLAIKMAHSIVIDPQIDENWKDVILIATLKSDNAYILFDTLTGELLENEGAFLRKIILLLEAGCMIQNYKTESLSDFLPVGSGWQFVIRFIRGNLQTVLSFTGFENKYMSLLQLWGEQLQKFNISKLPPSAQEAGELIEDYLYRHQKEFNEDFYRKSDDTTLKPLLLILFQLTSAIPVIVEDLIDASVNIDAAHPKWKAKRLLKNIRQYLIGGVLSDQICKYFPEKVLKIASAEWRREERVARPGSLISQIDTYPEIKDFGLNNSIDYMYDFPSGFQSFYYWLFLHHSNIALDFLIPFLNKAFEENKAAMVANRRELTTISISFGESLPLKEYIGSPDYWVLFRGTNSLNDIISSLLMALEKGLLDRGDLGKDNYPELRLILKKLILETNNVAVLAVVASVIQAYPELLDETSVKLLGVKDFYLWDSSRYSSELLTPNNYHIDPYLLRERISEDSRPHRKKYYLGLVGFVASYMFYHQTHNELLFKQVDGMWESLDEGDSRMRKFLFDMDARKYNYKPVDQPEFENMVQFAPGYDSQVQEMISNSTDFPLLVPAFDKLWAKQVFDNEYVLDKTYKSWKGRYEQCLKNGNRFELMSSSGPIAAVGLKDFIDELTPEEKNWCRHELVEFGQKLLKSRSQTGFGMLTSFDKPALIGLSIVFNSIALEIEKVTAKELIFTLLISNIDEQSKIYIELGITEYLNKIQPEFVLNCWYGLLEYIAYQDKVRESASKDDRLIPPGSFGMKQPDEVERDDEVWIKELVKSVVNGTIQYRDSIDLQFHRSTEYLLADALRIIPKDTAIESQREFIQKILQFHLDSLSHGDEYSRFEFTKSKHAIKFFYARYVLAQSQEIAKKLFIELISSTYIDESTITELDKVKFVYEMTEEFIIAATQGNSATNFWNLWEVLRQWMIENNRVYPMKFFLLDINWSESVESWDLLNGKNLYYKDFILNYGHNQINSVIKFLNGIAFRNFMPESISWIKIMMIHHFLNGKSFKELDVGQTEDFAKRAFYSYGEKIKNQQDILKDFLFILNSLAEEGSTVAYLLKEDLVQYKSVN